MRPPMFLQELFASVRSLASVRSRRHRRQERIDEEGAMISRRLQELLDATKPKQVETLSTKGPQSENDPGHAYRGKTGT